MRRRSAENALLRHTKAVLHKPLNWHMVYQRQRKAMKAIIRQGGSNWQSSAGND
jgi:hypothetical protein